MKNERILIALFFSLVLMLPLTNATTNASEYLVPRSNENQTVSEYATVHCILTEEDGKVKTAVYHVSKGELKSLSNIISDLIERLQDYKGSIEEAVREVCSNYNGNFPLLKFLLSVKPTQKRVFIVSNGFGKRFDVELRSKLRIYKPLTFWHYYGKYNYLNSSKTVIIDPILPRVRVLDGWQLGMMRRFVGLYIHISGSMTVKDHTFFMGYAYRVRALDLPDFT
ncbi:MAG TPA: hypothetical protein ENI42_07100 [Thermoplasmatales archaeon]|nr:hypothetical protein [Thermoplasmatales archaeon]